MTTTAANPDMSGGNQPEKRVRAGVGQPSPRVAATFPSLDARARGRVGQPSLRHFPRSRVAATLPNLAASGRTSTARSGRPRRSEGEEGGSRTFGRSGDVAAAPAPKGGPQNLVRQVTGDRISGRPDQEEQARLAATVGAALRAVRRERGLSLRDLERRSGVNRSTITRLERGLRRPRASVLGWLAWGLVGPDNAEQVKNGLCSAAGESLVAESRWSERSHARRAWRRVQAGGMEVPGWMVAPYAVAVLGGVAPDRMGELRTVQERAQAGNISVPEHMTANVEVLYLGSELDRATPAELRKIGRGMLAEDKAAKERAARKRRRELRAQLGLSGTDGRRPVRIPRGLPPEERAMLVRLAALDQPASRAERPS